MNLRTLGSIFLAVTLGLTLAACVDSPQPLSARAKAQPDPRLVGKWRPHPKTGSDTKLDVSRVSFDEHGIGYAEDLDADGGPKKEPMRFFVTRTEKDSYLNVQIADDPSDESPPGDSKPYVILRYQVSDDLKSVQLWCLNPDAIERAIKAGQIKGSVVKEETSLDNGVHLQDSAENIEKFFASKPAGEIFQELATAEKVD